MALIIFVAGFLVAMYFAINIARDFIMRHQFKNLPKSNNGEVLLVTAHPDDECMFFAPILRALTNSKVMVHLLCLSTGDFDGLGLARVEELRASCKVLGLKCTIIDEEKLKDGMNVKWDPKDITTILNAYTNTNSSIKTIMTFDKYGVSRHPNHCDVSTGVRYFASRSKMPYQLLQLESNFSIWQKYLGPIALIEEFMILQMYTQHQPKASKNFITVTVSWEDWWKYGAAAMRQHKSQLVWFRWLYLFFSRFMYTNTISILKPSATTTFTK